MTKTKLITLYEDRNFLVEEGVNRNNLFCYEKDYIPNGGGVFFTRDLSIEYNALPDYVKRKVDDKMSDETRNQFIAEKI